MGSSSDVGDMSFVICTICQEKYTASNDIRAGECGHVFHYACYQQWRLESSNCPICRTNSPKQFKLYLDFEESNDAGKNPKVNDASTTSTSATGTSGELDLTEYENLLYEAHLYRKEMQYMTKCLAEQDKLLEKKNLELARQEKRNCQMKCALNEIRRSIMQKGTLEHLVSDFINIYNDLLDDVDDHDDHDRGEETDSASGSQSDSRYFL